MKIMADSINSALKLVGSCSTTKISLTYQDINSSDLSLRQWHMIKYIMTASSSLALKNSEHYGFAILGKETNNRPISIAFSCFIAITERAPILVYRRTEGN